jgi:hypothetical protein
MDDELLSLEMLRIQSSAKIYTTSSGSPEEVPSVYQEGRKGGTDLREKKQARVQQGIPQRRKPKDRARLLHRSHLNLLPT